MNNLRKYVSQILKEIRGGIHVPLRDLPPAMIQALSSVGYKSPDIEVESGETYSPSEGGGASKGNRGFVIVMDMETGQSKTHMGSWGGANPFEKKQVEHDKDEYPIPLNGAVILGSTGGRGAFARIRVRPDNMEKMLPGTEEVSDQERKVLAILGGIKGGYRKQYFEDNNLGPYSSDNPIVQSLLSKKLIKVNKRGSMMITTAGKNARGNASPERYLEPKLVDSPY
jgi:hypothetical protein